MKRRAKLELEDEERLFSDGVRTGHTNAEAMLVNMFWAYICFTVTRIVFVVYNCGMLNVPLSFAKFCYMMFGGLAYDSSVVFCVNLPLIAYYLFPCRRKEGVGTYRFAHGYYVLANGVCVLLNMQDAVYYSFTGRRMSLDTLLTVPAGVNVWFYVLLSLLMLGLSSLFLYLLYVFFLYPNLGFVKNKPLYYYRQICAMVLSVPLIGMGVRGTVSSGERLSLDDARRYAPGEQVVSVVYNAPYLMASTWWNEHSHE